MLDDIGERIDYSGDQHLIGLQRHLSEATELMRMPRPRKRQNQSADFRLQYDRQYIFKRHVTIVRRL